MGTMSAYRLVGIVIVILSILGVMGCGAAEDGPAGPGVKAYPEIELEPSGICTRTSAGRLTDCSYTFEQSEVLPGESITLELRIINTGQELLELDEVTLEAAGGESAETLGYELVLDPDLEQALEGSESFGIAPKSKPSEDYPAQVTIRVRFNRGNDDQPRAAVLAIRSNASNSPEVLVDLGLSLAVPRLATSPSEVLDFGQVRVDQALDKNLTLLNLGSSELVVDGFRLEGNPGFSMFVGGREYAGSEGVIELESPLEIAPSGSGLIKLRFAPEAQEKAEGLLTIFSNDPASAEGYQVKLLGNQSGSCISVKPEAVQFGTQRVGYLQVRYLKVEACGDGNLEISGLELAEGSSGDFALGDLSDLELPLVVSPGGSVEIPVEYVPDLENPLDGNGVPIPDLGVLLISNDSFYDRKEVALSGVGSNTMCPNGVIQVAEGSEVIPQTMLHLYGDQSYPEGHIAQWEWTVDQPEGSQSVFIPSSSFPNPTFEANVAGTYVFYLRVWDENSVESCQVASAQVVVIPDQAIHIELLWYTPQDPDETDIGQDMGSDMDLHFAHPLAATRPDQDNDGQPDLWFDQPFDCYWFNRSPEWGSFDPNVEDDPSLDRDDRDGAGPENINLSLPEDVTYRVGVNYWDDHGFGAAYATVRVYIYSQLVWETRDVRMTPQDMWDVCTIEWPSGRIQGLTTPDGQLKITSDYLAPFYR